MPAVVSRAASATAFVSYFNNTDHSAKLYVEWSYSGHPFWHVEHEDCVAPRREWKTSVVYSKPDSGPQIRFYARVVEKSDCTNVFSIATRLVAFKDLTFNNGNATFSSQIFHEAKVGHVLCARGDAHPEKCDASDGYPPAFRPRLEHRPKESNK